MSSTDINARQKSTAARVGRLVVPPAAAVAVGVPAAGAYRYFRRVEIASYLQVEINKERSLFDDRDLSDRDYARVQAQHLALITSPMVIEAAVQSSEVSQLEMVKAQGVGAAGWLQGPLEASFLHDSPVLELRLAVDSSDADEAIVIVDAVMNVYCDQVLLKEKLKELEHLQDLHFVAQSIAEELQQRWKRLQTLKSAPAEGESGDAEILLLEESIKILQRLHSDWELRALDSKFQMQMRERSLQSQNITGSAVLHRARRVP